MKKFKELHKFLKMHKSINFIKKVLIIFFLLQGCKEMGRLDYIDDSSNIPLQVKNIKIEPKPGGAILTYDLPNDPILSYVKAVYEIRPNEYREAKASVYSDTLELIGYGDTLSHTIKIYSVGKNNKESLPIEVDFKPLSPPVKTVFETIELNETFGGVNIKFKNESNAKLAIFLMADSTGLGKWEHVTTFYTGAAEGSFSARGFPSEKINFATYIVDRWNNKSDTLAKSLIPLYEIYIPKNTWSEFWLGNDTPLLDPSRVLRRLWDEIINSESNVYVTGGTAPIPQWFTVDLGVSVIFSRMKMYHRGGKADGRYAYSASIPKRFEIWGINETPQPDGNWDGWVLLDTFESFKPSGQPLGIVTPEDIQYATIDGEDFDFMEGLPSVRFIRFKTIERYGPGPGQIDLTEISFWGKL